MPSTRVVTTAPEENKEEEEEEHKTPLYKILLVCIISYLGYMALGIWCYLVEQKHERDNQSLDDPEWVSSGGLVQELATSITLMIFSVVRILLLAIFVFERVANFETVSITWLSISTFLMMAAYFTACLNLDVFFHIHPFFITLFFVSIAFDFLGNVLVIIRHNA